MKGINSVVLILVFLAGIAVGAKAQKASKEQSTPVSKDDFAYSYGILLGNNFKELGLTTALIPMEEILNGIERSMSEKTAITEQVAQKILQSQLLELGLSENKPPKPNTISNKKALEKFAFHYGIVVATNWKQFNITLKEVSLEHFQQGLIAALNNDDLALSAEAAQTIVTEKFKSLKNEAAEEQLANNRKFMAQNKKKATIICLESGVQYEVLKEGSGKQINRMSDKVTMHYHGTLTDGKVFDSSVEAGQPIRFELTGVMKGWQEVIPLMEEGEKIRAYIPAHLGYGNQRRENIPPNSILIYEMELIRVGE
ncbi:FKBP-type peptidyl-prolyl cis-trans isomerase [Aureispira anguillae]|uniref:peptidylprolyl isomerase n=1 Tax=Aureispira anguillae TaxID=2864201 RepID=A0A916DRF3_9BACT|nr:FKBP-type peptidyl-prolyl cis-trans isomerase [Aureispira anguillae]BDS10347.1 FKBP-type peptidyl-prolyl cis-trans isomerase [Aureispira anguillae]